MLYVTKLRLCGQMGRRQWGQPAANPLEKQLRGDSCSITLSYGIDIAGDFACTVVYACMYTACISLLSRGAIVVNLADHSVHYGHACRTDGISDETESDSQD